MKIVAVRQPWAWLLVNGLKDVENRSWSTRYRGRLIIHASASKAKSRDLEAARQILNDGRRRKRPNVLELPDREGFTYGALIGSVNVVDVVTKDESPWFEGTYGWIVDHPLAYKSPIPASGRLQLFDPTPEQRTLLVRRERGAGK